METGTKLGKIEAAVKNRPEGIEPENVAAMKNPQCGGGMKKTTRITSPKAIMPFGKHRIPQIYSYRAGRDVNSPFRIAPPGRETDQPGQDFPG